MKTTRTIGMLGILALAFTFMSFSTSDDNLGVSYSVEYASSNQQKAESTKVTAAVVRVSVAATRRAIVYTKRVTPVVEETLVQASTYATCFGFSNTDKHSENYLKQLEKFKNQKINSLG